MKKLSFEEAICMIEKIIIIIKDFCWCIYSMEKFYFEILWRNFVGNFIQDFYFTMKFIEFEISHSSSGKIYMKKFMRKEGELREAE